MGLDFGYLESKHWANDESPSWSYGGFHWFRLRLARAVGWAITGSVAGDDMHWDVPTGKPTDPIAPLLLHSDCDGTMSPDECRSIAPRLRELVDGWPVDDYDRVMALRLAACMEDCARRDLTLQFC